MWIIDISCDFYGFMAGSGGYPPLQTVRGPNDQMPGYQCGTAVVPYREGHTVTSLVQFGEEANPALPSRAEGRSEKMPIPHKLWRIVGRDEEGGDGWGDGIGEPGRGGDRGGEGYW